MSFHCIPPEGHDPQLWLIAQRRTSFKAHLMSYLVINAFLWGIWFFTGRQQGVMPWPVWPSLGWGVGLFFHFMGAYIFPSANSVEREYQKLNRNNNK